MRVVSLGSGSSGNALLIEAGPNGRTKILVDAGFSERVLRERLRAMRVSLSQIQSILITHEHADHILGLASIIERYATPVIADPRTLAAIEQVFTAGILRSESGALVSLDSNEGIDPTEPVLVGNMSNNHSVGNHSIELAVGTRCVLGDIEVVSFPVSHDAVAPCGYLLSAGGCRVCVVIDSGEVTSTMLEAMNQADLLILESNHDRERLLRGPYPYSLKQRILSSTGHLSNDQAAEAVLRTWRTDAVRWLWLSHLSRTNNTPKIAMNNMQSRIQTAGANLAQIHISVLPHVMGGMWDSTQLWKSPTLWEMQM
ncbi:MAG TPA: MBL fold metallo-hydrolase [Ktedonobacteraceae bacterium]|nr:MBL fold metallo-hydrolase [Ktedonobacteraceae bacterium]